MVADLLMSRRLTGARSSCNASPSSCVAWHAPVEMVKTRFAEHGPSPEHLRPNHAWCRPRCDAPRPGGRHLPEQRGEVHPPRRMRLHLLIGDARSRSVVLRVRDTGIVGCREMRPQVFDRSVHAQDRQAVDSSESRARARLANRANASSPLHGARRPLHEGTGRGASCHGQLAQSTREAPRRRARRPGPAWTSDASRRCPQCWSVDYNREAAGSARSHGPRSHEGLSRTAFEFPASCARVRGSVRARFALLRIGLPVMAAIGCESLSHACCRLGLRFRAITGMACGLDESRRVARSGFAIHLVKPSERPQRNPGYRSGRASTARRPAAARGRVTGNGAGSAPTNHRRRDVQLPGLSWSLTWHWRRRLERTEAALASTYPGSCAEIAPELAHVARLSTDARVFDAGGGPPNDATFGLGVFRAVTLQARRRSNPSFFFESLVPPSARVRPRSPGREPSRSLSSRGTANR